MELGRNKLDIGHADSAAYALQGRSLATSGTAMINYVSNFYYAYDPSITRLDDHWTAFQGMVYAPAFLLFGTDAAIARQCNIFLATVVIPLCVAWLALALTGCHWTAVGAAALMFSYPLLVISSTELLNDVSLSVLMVAFAAAFLSSKRYHPAWMVVAGILGGLAWLCKGSQILLFPVMIAGAIILHGKGFSKKVWLYAGMISFLVVMAPRLWYNTTHYGNPLHSTQNHVSSFFGLTNDPWGNWDENFYGVYWGKDLPQLRDRFSPWPAYRDSLIGNARVTLGTILLVTGEVTRENNSLDEWSRQGLLSYYLGKALHEEKLLHTRQRGNIPVEEDSLAIITSPASWPAGYFSLVAIIGLIMTVAIIPLTALAACIGLCRKKKWYLSMEMRAALFLTAIFLVHVVFVNAVWYTMPRLIMPAVPFLVVMGLWTVAGVVTAVREATIRQCRRAFPLLMRGNSVSAEVLARRAVVMARVGLLALVLLMGTMVVLHIPVWHKEQVHTLGVSVVSSPVQPWYQKLGSILADKVPDDAIFMTRNPWEFLFYFPKPVKAVGLPYAEPRILLAVAKYYGVTHLMSERYRPGMSEFLASGHPGLTKILSWPTPVYVLDYSAFNEEEIASLEELPGYARRVDHD